MADRFPGESYPPIEPYDSGQLDVGDGHSIFWETFGSPDGIPAVWVHGGPGGPNGSGVGRSFDPDRYRAINFDQRGCGRSRPLACDPADDLSTNTTDHLVADLERLRELLGIERWVLVGVSWGVTLALVYGQRHPDRVLGMVLAAVTWGTLRESQWITRDMGEVFPEEWDAFVSGVPEAERDGDLAAAYARLLADTDPAVRARAADGWCTWEDAHVSLVPRSGGLMDKDPEWRLVFARLVSHYWAHGCFLTDGEVRAGMPRLNGVPGLLIHGRRDISTPLATAWKIHRAWPGSRLIVIDDAGHFGGGMGAAFRDAIDEMAELVAVA